jgi:hypothetical protein
MAQTALTPAAETATVADSYWVAQTVDHILAVMEECRSTWQMWHVRAEAQRQVRTIDLPVERASSGPLVFDGGAEPPNTCAGPPMLP